MPDGVVDFYPWAGTVNFFVVFTPAIETTEPFPHCYRLGGKEKGCNLVNLLQSSQGKSLSLRKHQLMPVFRNFYWFLFNFST